MHKMNIINIDTKEVNIFDKFDFLIVIVDGESYCITDLYVNKHEKLWRLLRNKDTSFAHEKHPLFDRLLSSPPSLSYYLDDVGTQYERLYVYNGIESATYTYWNGSFVVEIQPSNEDPYYSDWIFVYADGTIESKSLSGMAFSSVLDDIIQNRLSFFIDDIKHDGYILLDLDIYEIHVGIFGDNIIAGNYIIDPKNRIIKRRDSVQCVVNEHEEVDLEGKFKLVIPNDSKD